ncbi:MAG: SDR family NAD(P)-dependent oxidoreductase [Gemmatimonadetes bacterium]|nr:SDR family NAD(P)-dependent oxidoreductase [Gemmatimonadota bacterium]MCY3943279.1 SDR family NAD(P)-dependent oxidoreductase [Gemmatimonadota bacterium]
MNRIRGRTAVVTGATAGIGEACAWALAKADVRPVLVGRRTDRLEALAAQLRQANGVEALWHTLDVRDRAGVEAFAGSLKEDGVSVDILINNAGLARGLDLFHEGSHCDWDEMIDTNIKGVLNMTRALLPEMVARDEGHVVNVGSIAGHAAYPRGNVYCATKHAVRALTESANLDLVDTRVRMSSIDPGLVETEFSLVRFRGDRERAGRTYDGVDALRPGDVAEAVMHVLNAPPRVNVLNMVVLPTVQRSPYLISRARPASADSGS